MLPLSYYLQFAERNLLKETEVFIHIQSLWFVRLFSCICVFLFNIAVKCSYFLKEIFVSNGVAHLKIHIVTSLHEVQLYCSLGVCFFTAFYGKCHLKGDRSDC